MKKSRLILIFCLLFLISIFYNANAEITAEITNWKADNISGWACKDNGAQALSINFVFKDRDLNIYETHLENIQPTENPNFPQCNYLINQFDLNLYDLENSELLKEVLTNYPVYLDISIDDGPEGDAPFNTISQKINFSCIYENQTILKLTKPHNSHLYLGDQTTLDNLNLEFYPICYERIFSYPYEGDYLNYQNNCNFPLIYTSQPENTHVSTIYSEDYSSKICYSDLICTTRNSILGENPCQSEEKQVISLFRETNTHISDAIDENYKTKICCKTNYKPNPISEAKWYDMLGNPISEAEKCSWVQMGTWGDNLIGEEVRFTIQSNSNNQIYTTTKIIPSTKMPQSPWQTSNQDDYNFNVSLINSPQSRLSNQLAISNYSANQDYNISLITPKCGDNFTINQPINFNLFMNTKTLLLEGIVYFGDGENQTFSNNQGNTAVFSHSYKTDGTKSILIETWPAQNLDINCPSKSYNKKRKIVNIIIIDPTKEGEYIAACIDSPEDMSKIEESIIFCNASSTRAISYSPILGYKELPKTDILFNWFFNDKTIHKFKSIENLSAIPPCNDTFHEYTNPEGTIYTHQISCEIPTTGWTFYKYFQEAGEHSAELKVSII